MPATQATASKPAARSLRIIARSGNWLGIGMRRIINGIEKWEDYSVLFGRVEDRITLAWSKEHKSPAGPYYAPSHFVSVGVDGVATGCTCPDHHYRGKNCKHMDASAALVCKKVV